jgi:hypothetical protein
MSKEKLFDEYLDLCLDFEQAIRANPGEGEFLVYDHWLKIGEHKKLVTFLFNETDWAMNQAFVYCPPKLTDFFIENRMRQDLKQLWRRTIALRLKKRNANLQSAKNTTIRWIIGGQDATETQRLAHAQEAERVKQIILETIDEYDTAMVRMGGMEDERERMRELRTLIEADKKPKAKPTTDKRKMDESMFWSVIDEAMAEAEVPEEMIEKLQEKLETMSATAIKKFDKLFRKNVFALYHWDLWAMAYIMGGGCSDDAFEYFCAGLVLKGKDVYDLARNDLSALAHRVNSYDEAVECEEALYIAERAYENKTGYILPTQDVPIPDIMGEKWEEADLPVRYPEFCHLFNCDRVRVDI